MHEVLPVVLSRPATAQAAAQNKHGRWTRDAQHGSDGEREGGWAGLEGGRPSKIIPKTTPLSSRPVRTGMGNEHGHAQITDASAHGTHGRATRARTPANAYLTLVLLGGDGAAGFSFGLGGDATSRGMGTCEHKG